VTETPQVPPAASPRIYFGWYIVAAGAVANGMSVTLQGYANGVFFVPMSDELGWSRTEFALAVTVGAFVTAAAGAVFGGMIDRRGGRALAFIGAVLAAVSLVAISELTELWQWYVLRAGVLSVAAALAGTLVVHAVLSKWFEIRRGRAIGIAALGLSLAGVLTPNLLTPFVDAEGWRAGWRLLAVATLLLLIPAAMLFRRQPEDMGLLPDGRKAGAPPARDRRGALLVEARSLTRSEAVRTSSMWLLVVAFGLAGLSFLALGTLTIPILTDSGFDRTTAAAMLSLFALPGLLTRVGWGLAAERVHARYLAAIAFAFLAAGIAVIVPGTRAVSTPLVAVGFLVFGTGIAGLIPMQELVWASFFGRRHIGAVRGIGMPFQLGISASGPVIVSNYFDRVGDYDGVLLTLGVLAIVGIGIVLLTPDPQARLAEAGVEAGPAPPTPLLAAPPTPPGPDVETAPPWLHAGRPTVVRAPGVGEGGRRLPLLVGSAIGVWLMALLVPAIASARRRR
jgi:MFS transporter, OFA family, oxalate/formate antiporter